MKKARLSRRLIPQHVIRGIAGSAILSAWLIGAGLQPAQADYLAAEAAMKANDLQKAIPLLAEEAKLGNPVAAYNLGKIYESGGDGVPQDFGQAVAWYKLAADVGTLPTQFNGQQLGPDAADLIFAAQLYAQYNLGRLYEAGQGVEKDVPTAVQWYIRAAQQDLDVAQQHLVRIFRQGEGTVAPNPVESTKWLERLAQGGNVPAMTDLGTAYLQGVGVEKNAKIAHDWYLRGASQGSGEALFNLGLLYQSGYTGDADYQRAADYYNRAANKNSGRAMMALGDLYAGAQGVSRSRVQALAWYELAADRGVAEAVAKRDAMTRDMADTEVDQANTIAAAWQPQPDTSPLPEAVPAMPAQPAQPSLLPTAPSDQSAPAPDSSLPTTLPAPVDTTQQPAMQQPAVQQPVVQQPAAPDATTVPAAPPAAPATDSSNQPVQLPTAAPDSTQTEPVPTIPGAAAPAPDATTTAPADGGATATPLVGTPQPGSKPFGSDLITTTQPKAAPAPQPAPVAPAAPQPAPDATQNNGTTTNP